MISLHQCPTFGEAPYLHLDPQAEDPAQGYRRRSQRSIVTGERAKQTPPNRADTLELCNLDWYPAGTPMQGVASDVVQECQDFDVIILGGSVAY